jgi:hypothetical protein
MNNIQFTRYLYITEETKLALLVAILNKSDSALFWAYELYYSGLEQELVSLIWQIYCDFFATLNPAFATYLSKKIGEFKKTNDASIFTAIIQSLLYRPFNTDVFFLRILTTLYQVDVEYLNDICIHDIVTFKANMLFWIAKCDYRSVAQWILHENTNVFIPLEQIYSCCLDIFEIDVKLTKTKLNKDFVSLLGSNDPIYLNHILLSKIIELFSKLKQLKGGRSVYFAAEKDATSAYETLLVGNGLKAYHILRTVPLLNIDEHQMLGLFKLKRHKYNILEISEIYRHDWLLHAAATPLWTACISEYGGFIANHGKKVEFPSDDLFEAFHDKYGLEPDEQPKEVQQRSIMAIEKSMTWHTFYKTYRKNGLVEVFDEELEELDIDDVIY